MRLRRSTALLTLLALVAASSPLFAETIELGSDDGWGRLSFSTGVEAVPGRGGYTDLRLLPTPQVLTDRTDLHLSFDQAPVRDHAGRYAVEARSIELTGEHRARGRAGAHFAGPESAIVLEPNPNALFATGRQWSSFSLSFWLYPLTLSDGEELFEWRARIAPTLNSDEQVFSVTVEERRLQILFDNFFAVPGSGAIDVALSGMHGLIPRTWSYHVIRFDARSGLLEYLVDGRPEDATHVSASRSEDGTVFLPEIATYPATGLRIGGGFRGVVDDVVLSGDLVGDDVASRYTTTGIIESSVFDLGSPAALVTGVSSQTESPRMSDVTLYVRSSDVRATATSLAAEWIPVIDGVPEQLQPGRFVQVRAELYPGFGGEVSPVLSSITVQYDADELPSAPSAVVATPGDGSIMLEWLPVPESDVRGYLVYYGDRPGRYFGEDAAAGPSPLDVGPVTSVILDGLVNGTLYYLSVAAYDAAGTAEDLRLSREVTARPSGVYR